MSPLPPLLHSLTASHHVSVSARYSWWPWTDHPNRNVIGWRGESHDGGPTVFVYLVPDLDAERPTINVYLRLMPGGPDDVDQLVGTVDIDRRDQ